MQTQSRALRCRLTVAARRTRRSRRALRLHAALCDGCGACGRAQGRRVSRPRRRVCLTAYGDHPQRRAARAPAGAARDREPERRPRRRAARPPGRSGRGIRAAPAVHAGRAGHRAVARPRPESRRTALRVPDRPVGAKRVEGPVVAGAADPQPREPMRAARRAAPHARPPDAGPILPRAGRVVPTPPPSALRQPAGTERRPLRPARTDDHLGGREAALVPAFAGRRARPQGRQSPRAAGARVLPAHRRPGLPRDPRRALPAGAPRVSRQRLRRQRARVHHDKPEHRLPRHVRAGAPALHRRARHRLRDAGGRRPHGRRAVRVARARPRADLRELRLAVTDVGVRLLPRQRDRGAAGRSTHRRRLRAEDLGGVWHRPADGADPLDPRGQAGPVRHHERPATTVLRSARRPLGRRGRPQRVRQRELGVARRLPGAPGARPALPHRPRGADCAARPEHRFRTLVGGRPRLPPGRRRQRSLAA